MRETPRAVAAFERYCSLGPKRSLRLLSEVLTQEWGTKGVQKGYNTSQITDPRSLEHGISLARAGEGVRS